MQREFLKYKKMIKICSLIKLIRPINVCLGALSVLIIHSFSILNLVTILTIIVVTSFISISNIINDLFDQKTDKINKKEKFSQIPLLYVYFFLVIILILGLFSAIQLNDYSKIISFIILPFIIIYTPIFKGVPLLGNFLVSICVGLVFIFAEITMYNSIKFSIFPFIFSFMMSLSREIIKDLEDLEGDKQNLIRTFPVIYGEKRTIMVTIYTIILLNLIVLIPYLLNIYYFNYLIAVIIGVILPNVYCISYLMNKKKKYNYQFIQKVQKFTTVCGLFIIYLMKNYF